MCPCLTVIATAQDIGITRKYGRSNYIPVQINPFPAYPMLHLHSNDPGLLEHLAFKSHGLSWHSSISEIPGDKMNEFEQTDNIIVLLAWLDHSFDSFFSFIRIF